VTVFANGCFDARHPGHLHLLTAARKLGDRLVVAVNDDASVRRLKGPGRPLVPLAGRLAAVAATGLADAVYPFGEESDLERLIAGTRAEVVVKGDDYAGRPVTSAGRPVVLISRLPGYSTTAIIGGLNA
jgi:rfaE bifunctional protein nucleotidyltransferase chain/domain